MAGLFVCGAECGATAVCAGHWDTLAGTGLTLETTIIEPGGGANSYKWIANAAQAYLGHTVAQTTLADRFYFYFGTLPNATASIAQYVNANGSAFVKVGTAGQVSILMGAGSAANVGSAIATGAWHYVDVKIDTSGPTATMSAKLDGGTEASSSVAQVSANITSIRRGFPGAPTTGTVYIDQGYASAFADYPIGPGAVAGYRPISDGTHTATGTNIVKGTTATPVGAAITNATTDAYQWVDDATISSTGDFWNQQTVATEYVEVGFGTIAVAPLAVEVLVALSAASTAAGTQKSVLWDGVTAVDMYALSTIGVAHPTLLYKRAIYTVSMSGAWTAALFNALHFRWGYSGDATPDMYLDNVVLEVAYVPDTGNRNASVTSTGGGILTSVRAKGATRAGALTGGGVAVASITGGRAGSATATGGGVSAVGPLAGRQSAVSATGGGIASITGEKAISVENHNANVVATGGGVAAVGIRSARNVLAAATASGVATVAPVAGRRSSPTSVGGGVVSLSVLAARMGAALMSGGGVLITVQATDRRVSLAGTGGGTATVVAEQETGGQPMASVTATGGGVAAIAVTTYRSAGLTATGAGLSRLSVLSARKVAAALTGGGVLILDAAGPEHQLPPPPRPAGGNPFILPLAGMRPLPTVAVAAGFLLDESEVN